MHNQIIGAEDQQQQMAGQVISNTPRQIPTMHTEPDALKAEAIQRLKHYSAQEEKLLFELSRVRRMIHACQCMVSSFDEKAMDSPVPSREY
jgi:hypothetical protein